MAGPPRELSLVAGDFFAGEPSFLAPDLYGAAPPQRVPDNIAAGPHETLRRLRRSVIIPRAARFGSATGPEPLCRAIEAMLGVAPD